jgi:hypothetical protein
MKQVLRLVLGGILIAWLFIGDDPIITLSHKVVVKYLQEKLHEKDCTVVPFP